MISGSSLAALFCFSLLMALRLGLSFRSSAIYVRSLGSVGRQWNAPLQVQGSAKDDWFKDGLAFKCTLCGNCCSGTTGTVSFTDVEAEEMSTKLGISKVDFYENYTRRVGKGQKSRFELKELRVGNSRSYDCIFLDRATIPGKAICKLYESRPLQCRTWPFWPEILESKESWEQAKKGVEGCPGIGVGEVIDYDEILEQRDNAGLL